VRSPSAEKLTTAVLVSPPKARLGDAWTVMETNQRKNRHQVRVDGASKKSLQTTKKDVRDRKVNALTTIISPSKENSAAHTLIYIMSF
jgi:hypothetical protein